MAYKSRYLQSHANRAAFLSALWQQFSDMGWTLHDNMDGSGYRVYYTTGKNADRFPNYFKLDFSTANTVSATAYLHWNATTHAGTAGSSSTVTSVTTQESTFYSFMYGDLGFLLLATKLTTTYYTMVLGVLSNKRWTTETTTTAGISSGSNVSVPVTSSTGFLAGKSYQIVSANGEGRDWVTVGSIPDGTSLVINTISRTYTAGSKIGNSPEIFFVANASGQCQSAMQNDVIGTAASAANATYLYPPLINMHTFLNYDWRGDQQHVLVPVFVVENTSTKESLLGYMDTEMMLCPTASAPVTISPEDVYCITPRDSGTSTGSNTSTTLNDTGKTWTANAYASKYLVITGGAGSGQTRKIASNTATAITINTAWTTTPDATSTYTVCDSAYRIIGAISQVQSNWAYCAKEDI